MGKKVEAISGVGWAFANEMADGFFYEDGYSAWVGGYYIHGCGGVLVEKDATTLGRDIYSILARAKGR